MLQGSGERQAQKNIPWEVALRVAVMANGNHPPALLDWTTHESRGLDLETARAVSLVIFTNVRFPVGPGDWIWEGWEGDWAPDAAGIPWPRGTWRRLTPGEAERICEGPLWGGRATATAYDLSAPTTTASAVRILVYVRTGRALMRVIEWWAVDEKAAFRWAREAYDAGRMPTDGLWLLAGSSCRRPTAEEVAAITGTDWHPIHETLGITSELVSSTRVERTGGHDLLHVWNRGGKAGTLTLKAGDGWEVARRLWWADRRPLLPHPDDLGRATRDAWVLWAREQRNPKPDHLIPWDLLAEDGPERAVDRRIGVAVAELVLANAGTDPQAADLDFISERLHLAHALLENLSDYAEAKGRLGHCPVLPLLEQVLRLLPNHPDAGGVPPAESPGWDRLIADLDADYSRLETVVRKAANSGISFEELRTALDTLTRRPEPDPFPPLLGDQAGEGALADEWNDHPQCRGCGCTDEAACPGGCAWVHDDLCSACVERAMDVLREVALIPLDHNGPPVAPGSYLVRVWFEGQARGRLDLVDVGWARPEVAPPAGAPRGERRLKIPYQGHRVDWICQVIDAGDGREWSVQGSEIKADPPRGPAYCAVAMHVIDEPGGMALYTLGIIEPDGVDETWETFTNGGADQAPEWLNVSPGLWVWEGEALKGDAADKASDGEAQGGIWWVGALRSMTPAELARVAGGQNPLKAVAAESRPASWYFGGLDDLQATIQRGVLTPTPDLERAIREQLEPGEIAEASSQVLVALQVVEEAPVPEGPAPTVWHRCDRCGAGFSYELPDGLCDRCNEEREGGRKQ